MSGRRVNIIFPVEIIVRELDYRLALAAKYVESHHRIFIGATHQTFRLMSQMNGGLYVGKHVLHPWKTAYGASAYDLAKARGFSVVHLSEEGAIFAGGEDSARAELDRQLDPHSLHDDDFVGTWGEWQAQHYRSKRPSWQAHVRVTGHPRFDLYRDRYRAIYDERVGELRKRFGDFVLINTNWMRALHPLGPDGAFSEGAGFRVDDDGHRERFVALWSRVARTVPAYVELVHKLSIRRKDLNFVFRPHPGEDHSLLRAAFRGVPNVHVIHEGHVVPWILASRVMVHDGCTTGMEAYMLKQPVVSYQPVMDEGGTVQLANLFGVRCTRRDEAVETILAACDEPDRCAERVQRMEIPERAHQLMMNLRDESFPALISLIREAEGTRQRSVDPSRVRVLADAKKAAAVERAKRLVRPLFKNRSRWAKATRGAFYGFRRDEILPRLRFLAGLEGKRVRCRFYSDSLFEVTLA